MDPGELGPLPVSEDVDRFINAWLNHLLFRLISAIAHLNCDDMWTLVFVTLTMIRVYYEKMWMAKICFFNCNIT